MILLEVSHKTYGEIRKLLDDSGYLKSGPFGPGEHDGRETINMTEVSIVAPKDEH